MEPRVLLDYQFAVSTGTYTVRALVKLDGRVREDRSRTPLNLSLVLDRSGSMAGAKLAAARDAAVKVAQRLYPEDVLSIVSYDDEVTTVAEPARGAEQADVIDRIRSIRSGGTTNLSGGWLRGGELVARNQRENAANRILLLTDGLANHGITDPDRLVSMCAESRKRGITTTTIGFGEDYNEHLLRAMADAGGGHTYYIERPDQATGVFAEELEGLLTLAAQNVAVEILPAVAARLTAIHHTFPRSDIPGGARLELGDLYAREPKMVLMEFVVPEQAVPARTEPMTEAEADAVAAAGVAAVEIARVRIHAHALTAGGGIERQEIDLSLRTSLDRGGHVEAEIHREVLLQDAARARETALHARERGDMMGGWRVLEESRRALHDQGDASDPSIAEEIAELDGLARIFQSGDVREQDAKYMHQWAHDARRAKRMAMERISRTRSPSSRSAGPPLRYEQGDATQPVGAGIKILVNLGVNDGTWEPRGFARSLAHRWPELVSHYESWSRGLVPGAPPFRPGALLLQPVDPQVWVGMIVAKSVHPMGGRFVIRVNYDAIETGLETLATEAIRIGASVHLPKIGCDGADGRWARIEAMLHRHLTGPGIPVVVFDDAPAAAGAQKEMF
jgi:Ca-activated chloride channel family protein